MVSTSGDHPTRRCSQTGLHGRARQGHPQILGQNTEEIDVLITHEPPFGTFDKVNVLGCQDLTKAVARITLRPHVFGHVHGGHGLELGWSDIKFVNCAVLNEDYALAHKPTAIELPR